MTNSKKVDLHTLTESALMIALATVLSLIKVYEAPFGGSVTLLSMSPIIVLALRRGIKTGLAAGFVHSTIQLLLGLSSVAWVPDLTGKILCVLFDYTLPFTLLGLAGGFSLFKFTQSTKKNAVLRAVLAVLLVGIIRYICHTVSGVVVWYSLDLVWYADDPTHIVNQYSAIPFSLIYNATYMTPEIIVTLIGTPIVYSITQKR